MKEERHRGLLESSNISFGHMLKRADYESRLDDIMCAFLERNDMLFSNSPSKGIISIIIKSYAEDMGLLEVEHIYQRIYKHLDEDAKVEMATDYEENEMFRDYFNLTLIEI